MQFWLKACASALLAQQALARPSLPPLYDVIRDLNDFSLQPRQNADDFPDLRILPLGASITWGLRSGDGNGYRKWVRDQLRYVGFEVDMVGSQRSGTMRDNDNEGHSGFTIKEVHDKGKPQYRVKPNLVLLNAGTNDCNKNQDEAKTGGPKRMEDMVVDIFDNIPEVTVVLSGLFPNAGKDECTKSLNDAYGVLAARLAGEGRKIVYANLYDGWFSLDDLVDGTHPTDYGYKKMASVWWDAIQRAHNQRFLTKPLDNDLPEGSGEAFCDKKPGEYDDSKKTQQGSGGDDGPYKHKGVSQSKKFEISPVQKDHLGENIYYADLTGDGQDNLIFYKNPDGAKGVFRVFWKWKDGSQSYSLVDVKDGCKPKGVRWGDVDGDGKDDFICIGPEGNMYVSFNKGGGESNTRFEYFGLYRKNPRSGSSQTHVRLGDIDGDGRLDYCLIAGNGDITCWRNGGHKGQTNNYWENMGIVFTGKNKGNIDGVRFIDINGDHRSDWLYVNDDGSVDTYINNRGSDKSLKPDWDNVGTTHAGMGEKGARKHIFFGRIGGSKRADYVFEDTSSISGNSKEVKVSLSWWKNEGSGGTEMKADGNFYCDMTGDGLDDYIWVSSKGRFQVFRNIDDPPKWGQEGWVFEKNWDRKLIRIADIDGDGKCDLIFLNANGAVANWYKTKYSQSKLEFNNMGALSEVGSCKGSNQRNGVGLHDLAVRFADLNGDKKADFLCMDPDGRTFAMMSKEGGGYTDMGQVKKPEGKERANLRFVDVNGDGKADMLWLHKFGGIAEVWYNNKFEESAGSSINWRPGGEAYRQSTRGENQYFANLRATPRPDMIEVNPKTNVATTWFASDCGGGGSGDDGDLYDPELPTIGS